MRAARIAARLAAVAASFLALAAGGAGEPDPRGYWEGSIIVAPAQNELDVVAELSRGGKGGLQGRLWFPTHPVGPFDMEALSLHGRRLGFAVRDKDGVVSTFDGEIGTDGSRTTGTFREKLHTAPFALERRAAPPPVEVAIRDLADDAGELKAAFDHDAAHVRLLLVLSPITLSAKVSLKLIERYLLERLPDPAIRVYVVWEVPDVPGAESLSAQRYKPLASDPRVVEFWSRSGAASKALRGPLPAAGDEALNRCLLFAGEASWRESPPAPARVWKSNRLSSQPELPKASRFDAVDVATAVRSLLAAEHAT